ncbi:MAG: hypothetical protein NTX64_12170 [Elusimicrobia bacterium]|nr:hypothetical protein [Elusimicrobiota bacterium]
MSIVSRVKRSWPFAALLPAAALVFAAAASPGVPLEQNDAGRAASIRKTAVEYDTPLKHLAARKGVRFYKDWTRGKWGWAGMPVAAADGDKTYLATLDNIGSFFEPIATADQAYELVTFLPSYWSFSKRSVKRKGDGWVVKLDAVGMNKTQKTTLTYEVARDGRCSRTGNSNPKADPTSGIMF